jgi:cold shock CspA family protein
MTQGLVTKVVISFGSKWGRIRPDGDSREIFFNLASLAEPSDFAALEVGQAVEFDERSDQVNGSHAEHVVVTERLPVGNSA